MRSATLRKTRASGSVVNIAVTTIGTANVVVVLTNYAKEYPHGFHFPVYRWVIVIATAWTVVSRMLWKTKWSRPKLHDRYSSFGLSDFRKTRIERSAIGIANCIVQTPFKPRSAESAPVTRLE